MKFEDAINKLRPNTEWVCYGGTLDGLTFIDETIKKPTQAEVDTALTELKNESIAKKEEAESKLAALGLSLDDLKALGLG